MKTYTGIVHSFVAKAGFGFIRVAPSVKQEIGLRMEGDLFFHATGIFGRQPNRPVPERDDQVEFNVEQARKGPRAINIVITSRATTPCPRTRE